jgi:protein SCO1/2
VSTAVTPARLVFGMRPRVFWAGAIGLLLAIPTGWSLVHFAPLRPAATVTRESLPVLATLPSFSLTDQDGQPFDLMRMRGKVWLANFIFTTCPTVCPLLSERFSQIQDRTKGLGSAVQLVSFSVDPETDTPAVLKQYAAHYRRDPARWTYVTGAPDAIEKAVSDGFKVALTREKKPVPEGTPDGFEIVHGEQFVLVDALGQIRGYYHKDDADLDRLITDAALLAGQPKTSAEESSHAER